MTEPARLIPEQTWQAAIATPDDKRPRIDVIAELGIGTIAAVTMAGEIRATAADARHP